MSTIVSICHLTLSYVHHMSNLSAICQHWFRYIHYGGLLPVTRISEACVRKLEMISTILEHSELILWQEIISISPLFTICHLWLTYVHHMSHIFIIYHLSSPYVISGCNIFTICYWCSSKINNVPICHISFRYVHHMPLMLTYVHHFTYVL